MKFPLYINEENKIINRAVIGNAFTALFHGRYIVTIEKETKRTISQNAYYWSVCVPLVKVGLQDIGYREVKTNDDAHEVMKHLFLKKSFTNEQTQEVIIVPGSTSDLDTLGFNQYLEEIWQWGSEYLGINIPTPMQQTTMFEN